jgi:hypothetical protein
MQGEYIPDDADDIGLALDGVVEFMHLRSGRLVGIKPAARPIREYAKPGEPSLARIVDQRRARLPTHREECAEELQAGEDVHAQLHCIAILNATACGSRSVSAAEQSSAGHAHLLDWLSSDSARSPSSYSRMMKRDASRATKHYIGKQSPLIPSACRHARGGLEGLPMRHSGLSDISAMLFL